MVDAIWTKQTVVYIWAAKRHLVSRSAAEGLNRTRQPEPSMTAGRDALDNPVSTGEATLLAGLDDFVEGFLRYETKAVGILKTAAAAPGSALANAYAGALFMLLESPQGPLRARPFLEAAEAAPGANDREAAFVAFLRAWVDNDIPRAAAVCEEIVAQWPRDLVAVKLRQYLAFGDGDAPAMLRVALAASPACGDVPQLYGMLGFAQEQCHRLAEAEAAARQALEMTEREPWAQHALAHVMLTQGRIDEGERFMEAASPTWTGLNSFMVTHNVWHLALFRLSQGRTDAVLEAYDSQCWAHDRDYSQDQIGAVSLLARLELAGVDVGDRWTDLADHLAARGPDVEQPFLSLQYLYGLARAGRPEADGLMEAFRRRAREAPAFCRAAWSEIALPAAEGIVAYLAGRPDEAAHKLDRALPRLHRIGGSHAQRDLFDQIRLAALTACGHWVEVQQLLEQRRAQDPDGVPLNRALARAYDALGLPGQAAEARRRVPQMA
jgi:tetratricopeptide (TPR) repeat protein